jgi:hypothetical protein
VLVNVTTRPPLATSDGSRRFVRAKWPRLVDPEVHLETVFGSAPLGYGHDAGVVDQQIDLTVIDKQPGRAAADGRH